MLNNIFIYFLILILFSFCKSVQDTSDSNFLEIPFICIDPCERLVAEKPFTTSLDGTTLSLIFSGKNSESGFIGYNIWYGDQEEIKKAHKKNDLKYVLSSGQQENNISILDITKKTEAKSLPTIYTSKSASDISYFIVKILNVEPNNFVYVTASTSNRSSKLSNGFKIP